MVHFRSELRSSLARIEGSPFLSESIQQDLCDFLRQKKPQQIGIYAPMVSWKELSLLFLETEFANHCAYPKTTDHQDLEFFVAAYEDLKPNSKIKDLLEPQGQKRSVVPEVVFAPALALDQHGHRIGKGGGYYDRFFAKHPQTIAIGVVDDHCLHDSLDASWIQPHDAKMAHVLTQTKYFPTKETQP